MITSGVIKPCVALHAVEKMAFIESLTFPLLSKRDCACERKFSQKIKFRLGWLTIRYMRGILGIKAKRLIHYIQEKQKGIQMLLMLQTNAVKDIELFLSTG